MNKARRKTLQDIADQIEAIKCDLEDVQAEEEEYRDNIPENMQNGERYERAEEICYSLSEAISQLEESISAIESAI